MSLDKKEVKIVVLDFDGVVVKGSETVKREAWFPVFHELEAGRLGALLDEAQKLVEGGRGDRRDIARSILASTMPDLLSESEVAKRCEAYNREVQREILSLGVPESERDALQWLAGHTELYLNTATPAEGIEESLRALGVREFFRGIYGRPGTKAENLEAILRKTGAAPEDLIFVDDQEGSWQAAQEVDQHIKVVRMRTNPETLWSESAAASVPEVGSLAELVEKIQEN